MSCDTHAHYMGQCLPIVGDEIELFEVEGMDPKWIGARGKVIEHIGAPKYRDGRQGWHHVTVELTKSLGLWPERSRCQFPLKNNWRIYNGVEVSPPPSLYSVKEADEYLESLQATLKGLVCNGICVMGSDLIDGASGVAHAHPDCELHSGRQ